MREPNTVIPIRLLPESTQGHNLDIAKRLLHDVSEALVQLSDSGRMSVIDLKQVPRMTPDTYQYLKDNLSVGEARILIRADITIDILETAFPGVWWITHQSEQGDIVTEIIEVAPIPGILRPHRAEIAAGQQRLARLLGALDPLSAASRRVVGPSAETPLPNGVEALMSNDTGAKHESTT